MIFPNNFESKIKFNEIRTALKGRCLSSLGTEMVDKIAFLEDPDIINEQLEQVREFRCIMEEDDEFPDENFLDMRSALVRIQLKGSYMDEQELHALKSSLSTISKIVDFLNNNDDNESDTRNDGELDEENNGEEEILNSRYPALQRLTKDIATFPAIVDRIDRILNKFGKIKDDASPELLKIRTSIASTKRSITTSLRSILHGAQASGLAPEDASPTLREGRLVIPIYPSTKRKIKGIIHTESATGKTLFMEPAEVVEANNRIRTLEAEEQRAIIIILQEISEFIRPEIKNILSSYTFLGRIDLIRAKSIYADHIGGIEPHVGNKPMLDWQQAYHPFLVETLRKHGKKMTPLDITLTPENHLLLISGPNAGGKSITLSTAGLLQYMVQCGLSIPIAESSQVGMFGSIFLDIGDEQSIEDELSTYSGHLFNMKTMMKLTTATSLILIDEMGGGTEPQIGAAIAQAMLHRYLTNGAWGIITTHYQNLKYFAQEHNGITNGAMLYDRNEMRPLFQLQIGMPGSSFAIEIARKIGLPQDVIEEASEAVGSDYIQSDKYLQDIVRDKRYWENKRQGIHQKEKHLDELIGRYENDLNTLAAQRKAVIKDAQEKAESLIKESNAKIESTIRSIKEAQAEKEETKKVRQQLEEFKQDINESENSQEDAIARKAEQIRQRRLRHEQRKLEKANKSGQPTISNIQKPQELVFNTDTIQEGSYVSIIGQKSVGKIEKIKGNNAVVTMGNMKLTLKISKLALAEKPEEEQKTYKSFLSRSTRDSITEKSLNFKPEIDVRGLNGEEAINAVTYFIEDAILVGVSPLRILHGTGTGYLRQVIREYLNSVPQVRRYHDEHVQFGGAGITVVEM